MNKFFYGLLILGLSFQNSFSQNEKINDFEISSSTQVASIIYDAAGSSLDSIAAYLLAEDIFKVTGKKPEISINLEHLKANSILIGEVQSDFIKQFLKQKKFPNGFLEQKESYTQQIVSFQNNKKLFIISGTDPRGTAYGVFDVSKRIGVSPWYWWADAPVQKKEKVVVPQKDFFSKAPSVEYRGIFLNDEDWGLQPWAAQTFEPKTGDIGPKTYAKIFELLLRLRANTIWPAMHPSTRAFFHYPDNPVTAEKFHIVVGSSHAEPMLRNNVDEWDKKTMGVFNYLSNKKTVYKYWEERVKNSTQLDAIYTLGMRGIHDSGMEGVNSQGEAANLLSKVIKDQRSLIKTYRKEELEDIPQAFTVYKEVLSLYDHGIELPEDITIVWTDDNYGYIRRLSDEDERKRNGGGGVYYHASYWGRPHDYLWLSTTSPGLIREEMLKAYQTNNSKIWILNVGDLKPAEYNLQLFMDMAWDVSKFKNASYLEEHKEEFYTSIFGKAYGKDIAKLRKEYYQLAFERKPEFMGWSQTEPTTATKPTAYSPFNWGDEIENRIQDYEQLEKTATSIKNQLPNTFQDAYFELVYYPVKAASLMNKKWLYHDKAVKYSTQQRLSAAVYQQLSIQAYDSIQELTEKYNTKIAQGKWNHIMSMKPRNLPVYQRPEFSDSQNKAAAAFGISVENATEKEPFILPDFDINLPEQHFIDLYLKKKTAVDWKLTKCPDWIILSEKEGKLDENHSKQRLFVDIHRKKWLQQQAPKHATFQLNVEKETLTFKVNVQDFSSEVKEEAFILKNGIASIYAEDFQQIKPQDSMRWKKVEGLGYSGNVMEASPVALFPLDTLLLAEKAPVLSYSIYTEKTDVPPAQLEVHVLPTHPITQQHQVRLGIQWDNLPVQIVNYTTHGRSEEWKLNVLRNSAIRTIDLPAVSKGTHQLKIYMIDQGVCLDYMYLKTDAEQQFPYSLLPETLMN